MKVIRKISSAIIIFLGFFCLTNCNRMGSLPANATQYDFKVKHYDQYYEFNPDVDTFKSNQKIVLVNASKTQTDKLVFSIHPYLVIDQMLLRDALGKTIKIKNRKQLGTRKWSDLNENYFPIVEVQLLGNICRTETNLYPT